MGTATENRHGGIDWLRFSAVGGVMLYHGNAALGGLGWVTGCGWIGVDLFLVLSGLLVTQTWMKNPEWVPYLRRRALRVLPAYLATLLLGLAFTGLLATQGEPRMLHQFLEQLPRYLTFTTNLPSIPEGGLILAPLWSLSLEVQLWLVLPILAASLASRRTRWLVVGAWVSAILLARWVQIVQNPSVLGPMALPQGTDLFGRTLYATRTEAFLVGVWIALRADVIPGRWLWAAVGLGAMTVILGAPFKTFGPRPLPAAMLQFTALAIGCGALVCWARQSRVRAPSVVRWVSERIYSLYLAQAITLVLLAPVVYITTKVGAFGQAAVLAVFGGVSLLIGAALYHFVEAPFARIAKPASNHPPSPSRVSSMS